MSVTAAAKDLAGLVNGYGDAGGDGDVKSAEVALALVIVVFGNVGVVACCGFLIFFSVSWRWSLMCWDIKKNILISNEMSE